MAKRLQLNFHRPARTFVDENGQPRPCAMGVGWVNPDTMRTLDLRHIQRTDAKGRPLEAPKAEEPATEQSPE